MITPGLPHAQWRMIVREGVWTVDQELFLGGSNSIGKTFVVEPIVLRELQSDFITAEDQPWLKVIRGHANPLLQAIVDGAWKMGIKPTAYEEPKSELAAVRAHLVDMRAIVTKTLSVPLP